MTCKSFTAAEVPIAHIPSYDTHLTITNHIPKAAFKSIHVTMHRITPAIVCMHASGS